MKNFTSNPNKIQPESKPLETKKSTTRISFWWLVFVFTLLINTNAFSQSGAYRVQWISMNLGSPSWNAGEVRTVSVTLKNIGTQTWIDAVGSGDVNIGVKWNAEPDYMIRVNAGNLAPGATQTYNLTVTAPSIGGNNNLQFNVVRELICWLKAHSRSIRLHFPMVPMQTISKLPDGARRLPLSAPYRVRLSFE